MPPRCRPGRDWVSGLHGGPAHPQLPAWVPITLIRSEQETDLLSLGIWQDFGEYHGQPHPHPSHPDRGCLSVKVRRSSTTQPQRFGRETADERG